MEVARGALLKKGFAMIANGHEKHPVIDADLVVEALNKGVRQELKIHKALGNPIAIGRNGKVVWIPANEIQIDDEESTPNPGSAQ